MESSNNEAEYVEVVWQGSKADRVNRAPEGENQEYGFASPNFVCFTSTSAAFRRCITKPYWQGFARSSFARGSALLLLALLTPDHADLFSTDVRAKVVTREAVSLLAEVWDKCHNNEEKMMHGLRMALEDLSPIQVKNAMFMFKSLGDILLEDTPSITKQIVQDNTEPNQGVSTDPIPEIIIHQHQDFADPNQEVIFESNPVELHSTLVTSESIQPFYSECLTFTKLAIPEITTPSFGAVIVPLLSGTPEVSSDEILLGLNWSSSCDIKVTENRDPKARKRLVVVLEVDEEGVGVSEIYDVHLQFNCSEDVCFLSVQGQDVSDVTISKTRCSLSCNVKRLLKGEPLGLEMTLSEKMTHTGGSQSAENDTEENQPPMIVTETQSPVTVTQNQSSVTVTDPMTVSENHPSVTVSENHPSVTVTENHPSVTVTENQPSVTVTENQPSVTVPENQPTVTENHPSVTVPENYPFVTVPENQPSVAVIENHPFVTVPENQPSVAVIENHPFVTVPENQPSVAVIENHPFVTVPENQPSVAVIENHPFVTVTENQPSVAVTDLVTLTENQHPTTVTENQPLM
ncbi:hypothetical protein Pmani_031846 [Petrolisthes manimaculis]|uniref:Uncharacterized protein n=1 Tax=Petrolisthes manimaculis TaxID=1843537 RepID=A0AAE1NSX1_9EUCA|nr:hypothetical protein Pmani_031846 [Petrolisthes manimaculis]